MAQPLLTVGEAQALLRSGVCPVIEFTQEVDYTMEGPDPGMRGRLVAMNEDPNDAQCVLLTVELADFEGFNDAVDRRRWLDGNHVPCLPWRQSGVYPANGRWVRSWCVNSEQSWCVSSDDEPLPFTHMSDNQQALLEEYLRASPEGQTYVQWLEQIVLTLRAMH